MVQNSYPPEIEAWWLNLVLTRFNLKSDQAALKVLAPYADELSNSFTSARSVTGEGFQSLYESKQNQLAYGIYFFPQTYVRTLFPLQELLGFRGWKPGSTANHGPDKAGPSETDGGTTSVSSSSSYKDIHLLDLGSGAGASGFAAAQALHEQFPGQRIHLALVDQEKHLLHLGENLHREILSKDFKNLSLTKQTADFTNIPSWKPTRNAAWDLITISFSLNEAFAGKPVQALFDWLGELRRCLKPGGILLILEPSLKESSERLENLRNLAAASEDWKIWGPCLHSLTCPLLANGKYWCHEVRSWRLPRSIQMINNHMRRTPEDLKFSFLMLGQKAPEAIPASASKFRLIAPIAAMHGKLLTSGCNSQGEAAEYDLLTRHLDRTQIRTLTKMERGSVVHAQDLKPLGGKHQYRVSSLV